MNKPECNRYRKSETQIVSVVIMSLDTCCSLQEDLRK